MISLFSTNYWKKLIRLTQLLLTWSHKVRVPDTSAALTLTHSKKLWFQSVMPEALAALHASCLKELDTKVVDGIIVMIGRASAGMEKFFGNLVFL